MAPNPYHDSPARHRRRRSSRYADVVLRTIKLEVRRTACSRRPTCATIWNDGAMSRKLPLTVRSGSFILCSTTQERSSREMRSQCSAMAPHTSWRRWLMARKPNMALAERVIALSITRRTSLYSYYMLCDNPYGSQKVDAKRARHPKL